MRNSLFVLLVLILGSCSEYDTNDSLGIGNEITIYLVQEGQLELHNSPPDLKTLELEKTPWIKDSEIEFYDWSAHAFYLKNEKEKGDLSGRHFVVCSGETRLFLGVFFPMYLSSLPSIPSIIPDDGYFSPKDVIRFGQFGYYFSGEIENKSDFKSALKSAGLFREGIKVELISAKKKDLHSVEYSFKITNLDLENIWILDPDKMGNSRFHYITNGISFRQKNKYYSAESFNHSAFDEIQDQWYFILNPGSSITRKVELTGFSVLPGGKVEALFSFPGSNYYSDSWKRDNGRIWIGDYRIVTELDLN